MADNTNPQAGAGFPNPAENNQNVARKLSEQDVMGKPTTFTAKELADTSSAIDKLAEEKSKHNEGGEGGDGTPPAATAPKPGDGGTPPATTPGAEDEAAKKAAEEAAAAEAAKKAELEKAEELFKDTPKLPANASPKSTEAFSAVKIKAAQEISALSSQLEQLKKEKEELAEKLKNPIPPETEQEIKELREWRAKMDVDADPKFKEFDKRISASHEFIYAQLKKNPAITDGVITKIKEFGGPENVKLDAIFAAMKDPTAQRLIESKVADIEMEKFNKDQAIKAAKENIARYVEERQKQASSAVTAHQDATKKSLGELIPKLDWLKEKTVDAKLPEADRKAIEEHNSFVTQTQQNIAAALQDDSPEMRAIMITGMAQLLNLQRVHGATVAKLSVMEKQLKEANDRLAKIKESSVSRLRESAAAPGAAVPEVKKDEGKLLSTPATQALDDIAKQIMETRAKAGA